MKKHTVSVSLSVWASAAGAAILAMVSAGAASAAVPPAPAPSLPPRPSVAGDGDKLRALLAGGKGLTADEVARRAAATSNDAAARREAAAAAKAKEDQVLATLWPRLALQARYTRQSPIDLPPFGVVPASAATTGMVTPGPLAPNEPLLVPPGFSLPVNNYVTQAALTVPLSDYVLRTSTAIATATRSARAAEIDEQAARLQAAADARLVFYDWIRARGQDLVAEQALVQARGHLDDARKLGAAGLVSRADLLRAEAAVKAAELFTTRAANLLGVVEDRLRLVMHQEASEERQPLELGEDLLAELPPYRLPRDEGALYFEALEHRLEIRALDETEASLVEVVKLARTQGYPRLDLAATFIYGNPNPRIFPPRAQFDATWDASLVLSWTPTDIPGASASAREQAARARELRANRAKLVDGLRLEVAQASGALRESEAALASTGQGLAAAEESHRARRDLYQNGKATIVEVTDAETELTRARLELLNAHIDARTARVRLDHALGRDVPPR